MRRFFRRIILLVLLALAGLLAYGWTGYRDARADGPELAARADALIAAGQGGRDLGAERRRILLLVEDPVFEAHMGVDFTTPGAGITTITQSLAKRVGFENFRPGIAKVRQTGYALGLERELTKPQILALALSVAEMGRGPGDAGWITGFFDAAQAHYGAPPSEIEAEDFLRLVAVLIAPAQLTLAEPNPELDERVARISRLVDGACAPLDHGDVWLAGCAN